MISLRYHIEKGMTTMEKQIRDLTLGLEYINAAIQTFKVVEHHDIIIKVMNGGTPEGYAFEKYPFELSFDEEVAEFASWSSEQEIQTKMVDDSLNAFEMLFRGFELASNSLTKIEEEVKNDPNQKEVLMSYVSETGYNPFIKYNVAMFSKNFKGWKRAFLKEIKDEIGRRSYDRYKKKAMTA